MKIALVYDHVNKIGGAERILTTLHELYPEAPLFTVVANTAKAPWAKQFELKTSFLQRVPGAASFHEFFPVLPVFAVESFDLRGYDVVISITSAEVKGVITSPDTLHICYLLTPTRYIWSHFHEYFKSPLLKFLGLPWVTFLRLWDNQAAQRPDAYVTISDTSAQRARKYYRRPMQVIYPPVDTNKFAMKKSKIDREDDYFLVVSRLVDYKRIDLAIAACNEMKLRLKIVGDGLARKRLEKMAGPTIEFLGNLTEGELIHYYQNCRALIFPQEEDFGIVAAEALACGKPVIAFGKGGATEIVREGKTGEFFSSQQAEALVQTIEKTLKKRYSPHLCRQDALRYAKVTFKRNFASFVKKEWTKYQKGAL